MIQNNFLDNRFDFHSSPSSFQAEISRTTFAYGQQSFNRMDEIRQIQKNNICQTAFIFNQFMSKLSANSFLISQLSQQIDQIEFTLRSFNLEMKSLQENEVSPIQKQQSATSVENQKNHNSQKKNSRIHYKAIFKEKIFGNKQYKYRLNIEGKVPLVFFKERNISLKINLVNEKGQKVSNENAFSLNLKAYYSNGEEVGQTKKGKNFLKGSVNCTMMHGKASFDKLYPREVSRKLQKKKIVFVIYASNMGKYLDKKSSQIEPELIEPIIIYGVKVITKQTKDFELSHGQEYNSEFESQYVA